MNILSGKKPSGKGPRILSGKSPGKSRLRILSGKKATRRGKRGDGKRAR